MTGKTTWQIDPAHTSVEFAVKHMMFTTVRGRLKELSGNINVDEANPNLSNFLDADNHPTIKFVSRKVDGAYKKEGDRFRVTGDLTIRGTTSEITLDCTYQGIGKDPWGGTRAGFSAECKLDRRDWGLKWNQALETGGILVGNELRIEIDVQAVRQVSSQDAAA